MGTMHVLTASEQVAGYLREELRRGTWHETMPGEDRLVAQLGVGRDTIKMALRSLEEEGLLVGQGVGRRRKIVLPKDHAPPGLRVALLLFDAQSRGFDYYIDLCHRLEAGGHFPFHTDKSLDDLGRNVDRVARYAAKIEADAWIISSGTRDILEWFAGQEIPAFAIFGRMSGRALAGMKPDKAPPQAMAIRRLIALGHRRISCIVRHEIRQPTPARSVRAYLDELEASGIKTGKFHLPDWEESREGFARVLDSLFDGLTPPTALIFDEAFQFHAGYHHLSQKGLKIPQDVSLICTDYDPGFAWCRPAVSHIRWDYRPVVRRIVRWVNNVATGKDDRRQTLTKAEFVEGGTMGPAKARTVKTV